MKQNCAFRQPITFRNMLKVVGRLWEKFTLDEVVGVGIKCRDFLFFQFEFVITTKIS